MRVVNSAGTSDYSETVTVATPNTVPSDISIPSTDVMENAPPGSAVGELSTDDPDADEHFSYMLVGGQGSDDNGYFAIRDGKLVTAAVLSDAIQAAYRVRVRVSDSHGGSYEKASPSQFWTEMIRRSQTRVSFR